MNIIEKILDKFYVKIVLYLLWLYCAIKLVLIELNFYEKLYLIFLSTIILIRDFPLQRKTDK
jgi:hypothetical protein